MAKTLKTVGDVEHTLRHMDDLRRKKRELEAELDEGKEAIKAYMEKAQMTAFSTSNCSASLSKGKKKRFNMDAFQKERPKLYEKYLQNEEYSQLYFKVR